MGDRSSFGISNKFNDKCLNEWFSYTTTKSVTIRDFRLGIIHYSLLICIVIYIVVFQLWANLGYLKMSPVVNSIRLTLQQPTQKCNPNKPWCRDNFKPLSQLPYCCAANSSCVAGPKESCICDFQPGKLFNNYPCTWLGGDDAGIVQGNSISVTTLTHEYHLRLNDTCFTNFPNATNECGKAWIVESDTLAFTADAESYTVLIDHSVTVPGTRLALTSQKMKGLLEVQAGSKLQEKLCATSEGAVDSDVGGQPTTKAPCFVQPTMTPNGLDYFPLGVLLAAAGVDLDTVSSEGDTSVRYEGMIMNVEIFYTNTQPWRGLKDPRYVYRVSTIPEATHKAVQSVELKYPTKRIKRDLHGVLIDVRPGGQLAVFNFTELLLQLTTSLTLLAMATVGVNILAQYVLKHRNYYNAALIESTDMSRLEMLECFDHKALVEEAKKMGIAPKDDTHSLALQLLEHGWPRSHPQASGSSGSTSQGDPLLPR